MGFAVENYTGVIRRDTMEPVNCYYHNTEGRRVGRFRPEAATQICDGLWRTAKGCYLIQQDGVFLADAEAVRDFCHRRGLNVPPGACDYPRSAGGRPPVGRRIQIRMPDQLLADLRAVAAARHLAVPEAARRAIRAGLGLIGGTE